MLHRRTKSRGMALIRVGWRVFMVTGAYSFTVKLQSVFFALSTAGFRLSVLKPFQVMHKRSIFSLASARQTCVGQYDSVVIVGSVESRFKSWSDLIDNIIQVFINSIVPG